MGKILFAGAPLGFTNLGSVGLATTLRDDLRIWLRANVPTDWRAAMTGATQEHFVEAQREWFFKMLKAGYATPHWPAQWPGGGRSLAEQKIIYEEIARADAPRLILYFVALYHAACTLIERGTPEQQQKYLPEIRHGALWCQGFSEPNAGSDLASLKTRAERKGDCYVINGQKTWSTMAQYADRCLLLARSGVSDPPQAGLSYLLLDMRAKGVTIRPIAQITGDDEFAEVFFDDVEVPVEDRVGAEGEGWAVAQTTLASERGLTLVELNQRLRHSLWRVVAAMREQGCVDDPVILGELGRLVVSIDASCALADRYLLKRIAGQEVPGDASIVKLYYSKVLREFTQLGLRISGLMGQYREAFTRGGSQETGNWAVDFMNSYAWTIAGGSDEIQRNIIAEKLLGMPREPKTWRLTSDRP